MILATDFNAPSELQLAYREAVAKALSSQPEVLVSTADVIIAKILSSQDSLLFITRVNVEPFPPHVSLQDSREILLTRLQAELMRNGVRNLLRVDILDWTEPSEPDVPISQELASSSTYPIQETVGGLIGVCASLAVLAGFSFWWRRGRRRNKVYDTPLELAMIPYDELQVEGIPMAAGSFKTVYKAEWHGREVAVLKFRDEGTDFDIEASVFLRLGKHPSLTRILGRAVDPETQMSVLVTEFAHR